jgi:flavin-dependent dehydrogenase
MDRSSLRHLAMSDPLPVEIVGGGLAGLALGLGLLRSSIPVKIYEAGKYPRHRVCGEFITGLDASTIDRLGLGAALQPARRLSEVEWFFQGKSVLRSRLPAPALAISRHALDAQLAADFTTAGGELIAGFRFDPTEAPSGRVFSTGRRRTSSSLIGLKLHARGFPLVNELEFHLGDQAYLGICPVEDGRVNLCGLFRQRPNLHTHKESILADYLRASGLSALAERLDAAEVCIESCSAVAGVSFDAGIVSPDRINLGDTYALIPPFTGNGMAMALQSAELAVDPLVDWSDGATTWMETIRRVGSAHRKRFARRLFFAGIVHPFLQKPSHQRWLTAVARSGILPIRSLYHLLH